jgi:glycosyltransferase involved in cell wall biosynthesis
MKRKVLHVIYSLYRGGAERVIETQILGADRRRFEILVCSITGGGDLIHRMSNAGARVFLLNKRRRGDITTLTKLANLINVERVDLLHLHNSPGMFWGTLAQMLSGRRTPIVRTEHNPHLPDSMPRLYRALYPHLTRRARRVICVSDVVRRSFVEAYPALADRYVELPNGIRVQDFEKLPPRHECRAAFHLAPGERLIGTVGRMSPVKNHRLLIEAFARVRERIPDVNLAIIGEGELRAKLADYAGDLGVSEYVSLVKESKTIDYFYGALDVFALSSDSEGMPLTLLEALASGVPVVATEVGGIPEVVTSGTNGYLVPKGSAEFLAKRIIELLQDPAKARAMALAGRAVVRERFPAEKMIQGIERIYDEVLEERPAARPERANIS